MKHLGKFAILGAFIVASASFASATPISPGQATGNMTEVAPLTGTPVAVTSGTITALTFTASFVEDVYEGGANSICPTCLAFAFTFTNLGTGTGTPPDNGPTGIEQLVVSDFLGYTTDADYVGTSSYAPESLSDVDGSINYSFNNDSISPVNTSDELVIYTNATSDTPEGTIQLIDSSSGYNSDFGPAGPAVTPEPGTLFLLGTGLLGAAGIARRKFAGKFV